MWQKADAGGAATPTRALTTDRTERDRMAAFGIQAESAKATGLKLARSKWTKLGLALLILNEIRGLAVVGSLVYAYFR
jgi:hypothetical protein